MKKTLLDAIQDGLKLGSLSVDCDRCGRAVMISYVGVTPDIRSMLCASCIDAVAAIIDREIEEEECAERE